MADRMRPEEQAYDALERWLAERSAELPRELDPALAETARRLVAHAQDLAPAPFFANDLARRLAAQHPTARPSGGRSSSGDGGSPAGPPGSAGAPGPWSGTGGSWPGWPIVLVVGLAICGGMWLAHRSDLPRAKPAPGTAAALPATVGTPTAPEAEAARRLTATARHGTVLPAGAWRRPAASDERTLARTSPSAQPSGWLVGRSPTARPAGTPSTTRPAGPTATTPSQPEAGLAGKARLAPTPPPAPTAVHTPAMSATAPSTSTPAGPWHTTEATASATQESTATGTPPPSATPTEPRPTATPTAKPSRTGTPPREHEWTRTPTPDWEATERSARATGTALARTPEPATPTPDWEATERAIHATRTAAAASPTP